MPAGPLAGPPQAGRPRHLATWSDEVPVEAEGQAQAKPLRLRLLRRVNPQQERPAPELTHPRPVSGVLGQRAQALERLPVVEADEVLSIPWLPLPKPRLPPSSVRPR